MKTTKELARELGLIRERKLSSISEGKGKQKKSSQEFSYLIVIDFESTCWERDKTKTQEIIEFPAVLLNTKTGELESEFHYYVQPQEHPTLSAFCHKLTGISQEQVENGIPVSLCLRKFSHWLHKLRQDKNITLVGDGSGGDAGPAIHHAAIVTWSDWDLGVCLHYELRRKQIPKAPCFNHWIDLRATYTKFYGRKPKGLNGALQDVGITFEGREHSGLHDSRNTATLAWRMMRDGCIMAITKSLTPINTKSGRQQHTKTQQISNKTTPTVVCSHTKPAPETRSIKDQLSITPSITPQMHGSGDFTGLKHKHGTNACGVPTTGLKMRNPNIPQPSVNSSDLRFETGQKRPGIFTPEKSLMPKSARLSTPKKSLLKISPRCTKTRADCGHSVPVVSDGMILVEEKCLNSTSVRYSTSVSASICPESNKRITATSSSSMSTIHASILSRPDNQNVKSVSASQIAVSKKHCDIATPDCCVMTMLPGCSNLSPNHKKQTSKLPVPVSKSTTLTKGCSSAVIAGSVRTPPIYRYGSPENAGVSLRTPQSNVIPSNRTPHSDATPFKTPQTNDIPSSRTQHSNSEMFRTPQNNVIPSSKTPQNTVSLTVSSSSLSFKTPLNTPSFSSRTPQTLNSVQSFKTPQNNSSNKTPHNFNTVPLSRTPRTVQNCTTPSTYFRSSHTPQNLNTVSTSGTSRTLQNCITPSTYARSFHTPQNLPSRSSSSMKATPPLCKCGRRARRRMVQNPGPNMGRWFFSCVKGTANTVNNKSAGCGFFQWENAARVHIPGMSTPVGRQTYLGVGRNVGISRPNTPVLIAPEVCREQKKHRVSVVSMKSLR